jgi:hypothetical protein
MPRARHRLLFAFLLVAFSLASRRASGDEPVAPSELPSASSAPTVPLTITSSSASAPPLTITSNSDCPSGPAVMAALAVSAPPAEWPHGAVRIHATADLLILDLMFEEPTRREVPAPSDCAARAATVALVIATWTGKLSSDAAAMPVLPTQPPTSSAPAASVPVPTTAPSPPATLAASAANQRELGVGLLLAVSGGIAPGVALHFLQSRAPHGLGWQATLALPARRERSAAGGTTGWTRAAATLELNASASVDRFTAGIDAGLAGAYTLTSGQGYTINQDTQALTAGLVAGARLSLPWRHLHLWTDLRAYRWLFPQTVAITTTQGTPIATAPLPSTDLHWTLGLSYVFH